MRPERLRSGHDSWYKEPLSSTSVLAWQYGYTESSEQEQGVINLYREHRY